MKKYVLSLIIFFAFVPADSFATEYSIDAVPQGMSLEEFRQSEREVTLNRLMISAFVPGYIHFYADHDREAWAIMTARLTGYALMGWGVYDQWQYADSFTGGLSSSDRDIKSRSRKNLGIFSLGLFLNIAGFAYDWAHGDWIIDQERSAVRYRFGQKLGFRYDPVSGDAEVMVTERF